MICSVLNPFKKNIMEMFTIRIKQNEIKEAK